MDLQPGPFLQGTPADVSVQPGLYDFTDDALALAGELTAVYHDWDAFMLDLPTLAAGPDDPTLGVADPGLIDEILNETDIANLLVVDELSNFVMIGSVLLGAAVSFAPSAAWSAPSASFNPPDPNAKIVSPLIDVNQYTPNVTGLVGTPGVSAGGSVQLQNLTRVGQQNFVVGDTALITVVGTPGATVSWDPIQNGQDLGAADLGQTDTLGKWSLQGVIAPESVGSWTESWFIDDVLIVTFSFIVVPAGT